ncbi:MAG TPA: galactose ABC transporter substrate-binding protein [Lachnospiraceae bacterium]|nr:galactose ABC transporter substrate-binding protein [Lachnospiraceae bacterium]
MMKKVLAAVLVTMMAATLLCACSPQKNARLARLKIGVTIYDESDTFLSEMVACFKEDAEMLADENTSVSVTVRGAEDSQRMQNDGVESFIDEGCNVLCVNLVDRTAPSAIIDMAKEHNIPVIFFNRELVAEDLMQWDRLYYVGARAKQSGKMQGELAADAIKKDSRIDRNNDGKIQYVLLSGEPGHQDAIIRTETVVSTLEEQGIRLERLSFQVANWNRAQAQNRMNQMIQQYRSDIELVLSNNDDMALGAIDAYDKSNVTETDRPCVFGIDGTAVGLEAVKEGKLAGTVYNDKEGQALSMARLALAAFSGKGMAQLDLEDGKYIYLPYYKVTAENVSQFPMTDGNADISLQTG